MPRGLVMFARMQLCGTAYLDALFLSKFAKAILDNCCGPPLKPIRITQSAIRFRFEFISALDSRRFSALGKLPPVAALAAPDTAFSWRRHGSPWGHAIRRATPGTRADFGCPCRSGAVGVQSSAHSQGRLTANMVGAKTGSWVILELTATGRGSDPRRPTFASSEAVRS